MDRIKKAWRYIERSINVIGSAIVGIGFVGTVIVVISGHLNWRTGFFILLAVTVICMAVIVYGYYSRVAIRMFRGVSKADRMCRADEYAAKRITEANLGVWDFAWQDDKVSKPKTHPPVAVRNSGSKALDEAIRNAIVGGRVYYHEILTTEAYSSLLRKHLGYCREMPSDKTLKYRARIYDNTLEEYRKFPKIQFVIIDEQEVIFMSSGYEYCFSLKSKKTASAFLRYAHMAWDQADEWMTGVKDIVIDGKIVTEFDHHLENILRKADSIGKMPSS